MKNSHVLGLGALGPSEVRHRPYVKYASDGQETAHLRPIVPRAEGREPILLWLRGTYRTYTDYDLEVVGLLPPTADPEPGR